VGSNWEHRVSSIDLEKRIEHNLNASGWQDRSTAIVIVPELENWVWSNSLHVDRVMGWKDKKPDLRSWLVEQKWLDHGKTKPAMPKEAMEAALRFAKKPRSSSLYRDLLSRPLNMGNLW
jgi:hypothetical protein